MQFTPEGAKGALDGERVAAVAEEAQAVDAVAEVQFGGSPISASTK